MKTIIKTITLLLLLLLPIGFAGCGEDDEPSITGKAVFEETVNDITVRFYLQNEDGYITNTFKKGENICFCVEYKNIGEDFYPMTASMRWPYFKVYEHNGLLVGSPYDIAFILENLVHINPKDSKIESCHWILTSDDLSDYRVKKTRSPLPKGNYYSQFDLQMDKEHTITCKINFSVI